VARLIRAGIDVHCLRDLTRGGLAAALNELALDAGVDIEVDEASVPVSEAVRGACELLGLDAFYVANEGRCIAVVAAGQAENALEILRGGDAGHSAVRIAAVSACASGMPRVVLLGPLGTRRRLDLLSGEQLPRIC
jgi:hydrogenase expression/formation protein HypE